MSHCFGILFIYNLLLKQLFHVFCDVFRGKTVLLEQNVGRAGLTEFVLNADSCKLRAALARYCLRNRAAETADNKCFLRCDDCFYLTVV